MLRFLFLTLCVCLGGCGAFEFFPNATGVGIPSSANVRDYAIETIAGVTYETKPGTTSRMPAGAYIIASVAYTNERCHKFFEALEKFKQDSEIIDKILTAGIAAGSPLLALASTASAAEIARFTSQMSLANQLNKFSADVYAFSSFREQLKAHVFSSMSAFQKAKAIDLLFMDRVGVRILDGNDDIVGVKLTGGATIQISRGGIKKFLESTEPTDILIARTVATDYAALCSLANMKKIIVDALANTTTSVTATTAGSPTSTITATP